MKKFFLSLFLILTLYTLYLTPVFCQEPIILPPVTIIGEDKTVDIFERFQKEPETIMGELPKVSLDKKIASQTFLSLYFSAGGYNYIDWKIAGGKELRNNKSNRPTSYFVSADKLRMGYFGIAEKLREYNTDNFNFDFSFPLFNNTNLLSSFKYKEHNESLAHPSMGNTGNVITHQAKDAELNLGLNGKIGIVQLNLLPYYGYIGINDKMVNTDTYAVLYQEISEGLKLNASVDIENLSLMGNLEVEANQRPELDNSGANLNVYLKGKFEIPIVPHLQFNLGLQYTSPYLFSQHFNPEVGISYKFYNGVLIRAIFKGETILPSYKLFTGNYMKFNPLLKEEQDWYFAFETEKDFGKQEDKFRGDANFKFFNKNQENLITPGNKNNLWQPFNISSATQFGIKLGSNLQYSIWAGDIYGKIDYTLRQIIPGEGLSVPYFPNNELLTKFGYKAGPFKIEIGGDLYSSCYADTQATSVVPGYFITNLNILYGITKEIFIFLNGENLFNVQYYILDDYPTAGRNFRGGVEIKF